MPRPSPITDAVRSLVTSGDHHAWALDELHARIRQDVPTANFSTILRAVGTLERDGSLQRVEVGDGKARYESPQRHHEHIRCSSCGQVAEIPGCLVEDAAVEVARTTGYRVTSHHVVFTGLCPRCRPAGGL